MPLHKVPPRLWEALRLERGIYARLPAHYLRALREEAAAPAPAVHWRRRPAALLRTRDPLAGHWRRRQDVPIEPYFPPESQEGLWGGEGWVSGYRYANNDKTPKSELCSKLGMDLKRIMLLRLARRDPALHPDDPAKREAIYDKYKEFVIPEEEAEWVGLSLEEAVEKQRLLEKKDPIPLFKIYVEELVQQLQEQKLSESAEGQKT